MPITYTLDQEKRLILTRVAGKLTIGETFEYFARLRNDKECPDNSIEIVDFGDVTDFVLQYSEMRAITLQFQNIKTTKNIISTVFKCESSLAYGIARMLQTLHDIVNDKHLVHIARSDDELTACIQQLRAATGKPV